MWVPETSTPPAHRADRPAMWDDFWRAREVAGFLPAKAGVDGHDRLDVLPPGAPHGRVRRPPWEVQGLPAHLSGCQRAEPHVFFGLMKSTSACSTHPDLKSMRNQPSLFFSWKRVGDRLPNSLRSY